MPPLSAVSGVLESSIPSLPVLVVSSSGISTGALSIYVVVSGEIPHPVIHLPAVMATGILQLASVPATSG